MRVGMFSNAYRPVISGVVRSINLFKQGLEASGHFVAVFAPDTRNYEDHEPFIFRYSALPLPSGMDYTFPVVVAPQIDWLVPRLKLDVVHAHHPFIVGREALSFSRSLRVPLVFTFHTMYHEYTHYIGFETSIVKQIVRRVVGDYARKADRIIAPSTQVRDMVLPEYNIDLPVDVLPTPVDMSLYPERLAPPLSNPDEITLIYIGRVAKEKNLDFLLRAFERTHQEDPRIRLRIVGGGPEFDKITATIRRMNLSHCVEFTGVVPFEKTAAELLKADMFVFASTTETQGLVVLEAMAAGLPLVLVHSQALLDCARPGLDCLTVAEDETEFAQAILSLVRDPARAQAMGVSARGNARNYSVPVLTERLLDIYQDTIAAYARDRLI